MKPLKKGSCNVMGDDIALDHNCSNPYVGTQKIALAQCSAAWIVLMVARQQWAI